MNDEPIINFMSYCCMLGYIALFTLVFLFIIGSFLWAFWMILKYCLNSNLKTFEKNKIKIGALGLISISLLTGCAASEKKEPVLKQEVRLINLSCPPNCIVNHSWGLNIPHQTNNIICKEQVK